MTFDKFIEEEVIPGGLSGDMSIEDIAKKHDVDLEELKDEYEKGVKVEMEHTDDEEVAKEISRDHLFEDPKYYTKLAEIENESVVTEAFIGPFVFNDKMSDEELLGMYNGALDGYANYAKGFQHSKSDYKRAYQEIEKILKKRGVSVDESVVTEGKFDGIADLVKSLHFETDPKTAEEKKIELGRKQGEVSKRKQIESGEYSLRRFRKEIKFGDGTYLGVFLPGSYDAAISTLGDGPHKKAVAKIKWSQKKYNQWLEDMASNGGAENAFDMAQNAKNEPGLIDWVKKSFRGEDPLQRIQWDIEGYAESNKTTMKYVQLFEQFIK